MILTDSQRLTGSSLHASGSSLAPEPEPWSPEPLAQTS